MINELPLAPMAWVKMPTNLLNNSALGMLPPEIQLRYFQLYLLAGRCNSNGAIRDGRTALEIGDIAWVLHADQTEFSLALDTLIQAGLIDYTVDDLGNTAGCRVVSFEEQQRLGSQIGEIKSGWHAIFERDSGHCVYCGRTSQHVDHIHPRIKGGTDEASNLVSACARCNQSKHDSEWLEWYRRQPFFNPDQVIYITAILSSGGGE